jgi:maltose O-acetyltransferase
MPARNSAASRVLLALTSGFCSLPIIPKCARWRLLAASGLPVTGVGMEAGVRITNRNIVVGRGSYMNRGVVLGGAALIRIGEKVAIGHDAMIITSTHLVGPAGCRAGSGVSIEKPVTIEAGTWIGARALILPGVTVGSGCVIAAGAVVAGNCEPNGLYAGVPAKRIKNLDE